MRSAMLKTSVAACAGLLLAGCATLPTGPSLQALPGSRMSAAQFAADDGQCRNFALAQLGGYTPSDAANQSTAAGAATGAAVGAVAGALIDGSSGAAAGAGVGLLFGAAAGSSAAPASYYATQQQYDYEYFSCMYAHGHRVPVPAYHAAQYRAQYESVSPRPPSSVAPPPPADMVPPDYRPPTTPPPR
jgi:hypothetical protein